MNTRTLPGFLMVIFGSTLAVTESAGRAADQVVTSEHVTINGQPLVEGQSRLRVGKHFEGVNFAAE
jgi:hypothetical protein